MSYSSLHSTVRFLLAIAGLMLAIAIVSPPLAAAQGGPSARASKSRCAGADKPTSDMRRFRGAVLCLHQLERRSRGLKGLRWNRDLSKAAGRHARDMVRRSFFDHVSPGRNDHMDRIAAGGYRPRTGCWSAGENLFYSRAGSTPRQVLRAWMASQGHRLNILRRGWHDFGLGVVETSPYGEPAGLTVVALFGKRAKRSCG